MGKRAREFGAMPAVQRKSAATMRIQGAIAPALVLASVLCLAGCAHIGPRSIPVDRFDYSQSIAESWKRQTLLNIVKMRYMDLPVFVDVSSVVSGYSMETSGNIGGEVFDSSGGGQDNLAFGGRRTFTDRPTITYTPLTGEKFLRGLITPIDPKNIFAMIQSGYSADFILAVTVDSLNGVRNRRHVAGGAREADPAFVRALELIREMQAAGTVGLQVEEDKVKGSTGVFFFRPDSASPDISEKAAEVRRLLNMPADRERFTLVYSPIRAGDDQLAVGSRSMLQIMQTFSTFVSVPEEHLADQSAVPVPKATPAEERDMPSIKSSKKKPEYAFASVYYRDYWFWVDDRDWRSKRVFTAIMFFFSVTQGAGDERGPLITIPAQ